MRPRISAIAAVSCVAAAGLFSISGMTRQGDALDRAEALAALLRSRAIDLTHTFDERTIYWPKDEHFHHDRTRWGEQDGGGWYASATYGGSEHGGTHLDSPIHFAEGRATTDQIPVRSLIGPAVVVDVAGACDEDRDYELRVEDLTSWEADHGPIPDGAIVLVRTGFGAFWPDKKRYLGTDTPGDVDNLHFPGIGPEAARWLVAERAISGIGLDTASLDHGPSTDFDAHRILNGAGLFGLENVANLDQLPEAGAVVIALPMKIGGGSGGPTRIVAILPER
ncbi:cyclase family protein [Tautonia plasticadhaerens]|uniref:Kynurenine formamidase n=1 Tax=Tautonia plasticadhaerens TaxID=2527974 RepID=A0A518HD90_9BACT|nr:cyclase family protein [Tautonia plasticadhaerens]QDV38824.1 Kynurenine formamidase [Tautonia plasticadhaerens]